MAAYLIGMINVTDPDRYGEYSKQAPGVFKQFGAKPRVRGGEVAALEGPEPAGRNVVVEFSDMDRLRDWYNSDAYAEILKIREGAAQVTAFALDGDALGDLPDGAKPGYFVARVTIRDPDAYGKYVESAIPLVKAAGGAIIARGDCQYIEGADGFEQGLIITFPSFEEARDFYYSDSYQALIPSRDGAADVHFYVLEGA
jgi:uncharacterized protein (DUF1330 family)